MSRGLDRLKRVIWRLQPKDPTSLATNLSELRRALMIECGTSPSTIRRNMAALLEIGWLRRTGRHQYAIVPEEVEQYG